MTEGMDEQTAAAQVARERRRPVPSEPAMPPIEAVLFDFDGTLTRQGAIDFDGIRAELGVPEGVFILEHLETLAPDERARAEAVVLARELEAAARSVAGDAAEAAVTALLAMGLPLGIVTRNALAGIERSLANFSTVRLEDFAVIVTRDDHVPPKPSPDGILLACSQIGVTPTNAMMVGDFQLDVEAGLAAGAITVYLMDEEDEELQLGAGEKHPADGCHFVIDSLAELEALARRGR